MHGIIEATAELSRRDGVDIDRTFARLTLLTVVEHLDRVLHPDELRALAEALPLALSIMLRRSPRDSRLLTWCLEVARFPTIELSVTRIDGAIDGLRAGAGTGTVTLHGTLTLRDLTREVAIPAAYAWEGPNLRIKGRYDMKWTDWNLPDPSTVLSTVAPDMYVRFDVLGRPG